MYIGIYEKVMYTMEGTKLCLLALLSGMDRTISVLGKQEELEDAKGLGSTTTI